MAHAYAKTLKTFKAGAKTGQFYSLPELGKVLGTDLSRLPVSIRIVLEAVLRNCDGKKVTEQHVRQLASWKPNGGAHRRDSLRGRPRGAAGLDRRAVTGRPGGDAQARPRNGREPKTIEPLVPVDMVVDHSVRSIISPARTRST